MTQWRIDLFFPRTQWRLGTVLNVSEVEAEDMYKRIRDAKAADGIRLVRISQRIQEAHVTAGTPGAVAGTEL
jgi:tRNA G26 N,N-dimethylase Trm1